MRKGANGLHAQVTERLGKDPKTGALFVFTNRRRTRLKILCWDRTVLCSPPLRLPRKGGQRAGESTFAESNLHRPTCLVSPQRPTLITNHFATRADYA